jgi:hypothetical protein
VKALKLGLQDDKINSENVIRIPTSGVSKVIDEPIGEA